MEDSNSNNFNQKEQKKLRKTKKPTNFQKKNNQLFQHNQTDADKSSSSQYQSLKEKRKSDSLFIPNIACNTEVQSPLEKKGEKASNSKNLNINMNTNNKLNNTFLNQTLIDKEDSSSDTANVEKQSNFEDFASSPSKNFKTSMEKQEQITSTISTLMHLSRQNHSSFELKLKEIQQSLKSEESSHEKMIALQELNDILSMATEDMFIGSRANGFNLDDIIKSTLSILKGDSDTMDFPLEFQFEDDDGFGQLGSLTQELMLLSCRCLSNLIEALPSSISQIVHQKGVKILVQKLMNIQYIDLAEQVLQVLFKISVEFPGVIVKANGLVACLQYIDFFSIHVQRTAISIAANACKGLPSVVSGVSSPDDAVNGLEQVFKTCKEIIPILEGLLKHSDQKLSEQTVRCLSRMIDWCATHEKKLEELIPSSLLEILIQLINVEDSSSLTFIYTDLVKILVNVAKCSAKLAFKLVQENNIFSVIENIFTAGEVSKLGSTELKDKKQQHLLQSLMKVVVNKPVDQILELLCLISEILPALPKKNYWNFKPSPVDNSTKFSPLHIPVDSLNLPNKNTSDESPALHVGDIESSVTLSKSATVKNHMTSFEKIEEKLNLLKSSPLLLNNFLGKLLPILVSVFSTTVNANIRLKVLECVLKGCWYASGGNCEGNLIIVEECKEFQETFVKVLGLGFAKFISDLIVFRESAFNLSFSAVRENEKKEALQMVSGGVLLTDIIMKSCGQNCIKLLAREGVFIEIKKMLISIQISINSLSQDTTETNVVDSSTSEYKTKGISNNNVNDLSSNLKKIIDKKEAIDNSLIPDDNVDSLKEIKKLIERAERVAETVEESSSGLGEGMATKLSSTTSAALLASMRVAFERLSRASDEASFPTEYLKNPPLTHSFVWFNEERLSTQEVTDWLLKKCTELESDLQSFGGIVGSNVLLQNLKLLSISILPNEYTSTASLEEEEKLLLENLEKFGKLVLGGNLYEGCTGYEILESGILDSLVKLLTDLGEPDLKVSPHTKYNSEENLDLKRNTVINKLKSLKSEIANASDASQGKQSFKNDADNAAKAIITDEFGEIDDKKNLQKRELSHLGTESSKFLYKSSINFRLKSFLHVFLNGPTTSRNFSNYFIPGVFKIVVLKLQELCSRIEKFQILSATPNLDKTKYFLQDFYSPAQQLNKQLKLKLVPHGNLKLVPKHFQSGITVSIHAIATFSQLESFLKPKLVSAQRRKDIGSNFENFVLTENLRKESRLNEENLVSGQEIKKDGVSNTVKADIKKNTVENDDVKKNENLDSNEDCLIENAEKMELNEDDRDMDENMDDEDDEEEEDYDDEQELINISDIIFNNEERRSAQIVNGSTSAILKSASSAVPSSTSVEEISPLKEKFLTSSLNSSVNSLKTKSEKIETSASSKTSINDVNATTSTSTYLKSYAEVAAPDFYLEFNSNGEIVSPETTIFSAVYNNEKRKLGGYTSISAIWGHIYTIGYKLIPNAEKSKQSSQANETSLNSTTSADERRNPFTISGIDGSSMEGSSTGKVLTLLKLLYQLNLRWSDFFMEEEYYKVQMNERNSTSAAGKDQAAVAAEGPSSLQLEEKLFVAEEMGITTVDPEIFLNSKLTAKLNRQLDEPLIVASRILPDWCAAIAKSYSFLVPFETRLIYLQSTSFGYSRSFMRWQQQQLQQQQARSSGVSSVMAGVNSRDYNSPVNRVQRQKVRIVRGKMLESMVKVMDLYGKSQAVLEIEFFDEVGTGLGPTLEFYSDICKLVKKKNVNFNTFNKLKLWRDDSAAEEENSSYVKAPLGLFPIPIQYGTNSDLERTQNLIFKSLGTFVAKALIDGRIIDFNFNEIFLTLLLETDVSCSLSTEATSQLHAIKCIDPQLHHSLLELLKFLKFKNDILNKTCLSVSEREKLISEIVVKGARLEDLCLDFTLPGYPLIELITNGKSVSVKMDNLEEYIQLVVDFTVGNGISKQIESFRSGMNLVFNVNDLKCFSILELCLMFGGEQQEDWTYEAIMENIKADHGYTIDSKTIKNLISMMSKFNIIQRRKFLQFVTGSVRLPMGGFKCLKPTLTVVCKQVENIGECGKIDDYLPSVMTCVNYLKVPDYSSEDIMTERFIVAFEEGQGSFHLS
ncbi:Ubiquitin fusion degradation protein 4 [Clydaea vesicula]|uniref:HECT-type E3 ubiquitin transferase n=1 Tax=Clydaea vesicula TaxID=447962 RepID=A0AAD5Y0D6_9FUNG|nr:Ubiquitin fusion degradation protein 4 [Clydaea vesicula]